MSTNKLTNDLECPIDVFFIDVAEKMLPFVLSYKWVTPNMVTFGSFASRIVSYNLLLNSYGILFLLFFYLSYILDCLDGKLARARIGEDSTFRSNKGDFYDHVSDILSSSLGFLIFIELSESSIYCKILTVFLSLISVTLMCLHLGAQEKYSFVNGLKTSDSLYLLQYTCKAEKKEDIEEYLKKTRYFGCGTANVFISILMYLLF